MSLPERYALTPLERATGIVIDVDEQAPRLPSPPPGVTSRQALDEAIRSALRRPPCLVSFSGGRDSSAVLAVAAAIAREESLAAPVAVTYRYPEHMAAAGESEWQDIVIAHAQIDDWIRIEIVDEMDCLGPIGLDVLHRHRLLFPFAAHSLVPALRLGAGGSLLTGIGGDEILGRRSRLADVLARRVKPGPRDVARAALAVGPRRLRRARGRAQVPTFVDWLTPLGRSAFEHSWGELLADIPVRWGMGVEQTWRSRALQMAVAGMDVVAREHDVQVVHPLFSPLFVAVLARQGGVTGYAGRTEAMRMLFADVLPDEISSRRTKAAFGQPYWARHSQEFARAWTGEGLDPDLVDVDVLRRHWAGEEPPPAPTLVLLKQAWLAQADRDQASESASTRKAPAASS